MNVNSSLRLIVAAVLAVSVGCNVDYSIGLTQDLELARFYPDSAFALVDTRNNAILISPKIDRYAYGPDWVAGHVAPMLEGPPGSQTLEVGGFFFVEAPTRTVKKGLTWLQLRHELDNKGLQVEEDAMVLVRPTRAHCWSASGRVDSGR